MKLSNLDYVQQILAALDSDQVNSVSDTAESRQVLQILRTAYYNIISRANLPEHSRLFNLVASGNNALPVLMYRPDNVVKIEWIKYDKSDDTDPATVNFQYITILPVGQFLEMTQAFNPEDDDVSSFSLENFVFYFKNDQQPTYCTILNDYYIIFDTFEEDLESTLQASKTQCFGQITPAFLLTDIFIPDLDEQQIPLLLNEAKSLAFLELKQTGHDLAVLEARRHWRSLGKNKHLNKASDFSQLPNFGRK